MTPLHESYREMPLTKGKVAIVDADDYEWLSQWKWSARFCNSIWYAVRGSTCGGKRKDFSMHREILGLRAGDGREVDHINRNSLDNRRINLRVSTRKENCANRGPRERSEPIECNRLEALFPSGTSVNFWRGMWMVKISPLRCKSVDEVESLAKKLHF